MESPKLLTKEIKVINISDESHEFKLIANMFKMGNCELNFVSKIKNMYTYNRFSERLAIYNGKMSSALLFFANTLETLEGIITNPKSFSEVSPQDLIFSTDLSIAYHFYKKHSEKNRNFKIHNDHHKWKAMIAGVILENVWNESRSYTLFAINFRERAKSLIQSGYNIVYFSSDNFYLSLIPDECIPIYLLDFTFM